MSKRSTQILGYDTDFDGMVDVTEQPSDSNFYTIYDYGQSHYRRDLGHLRFPIFSYAMYF